MPPLYRSVLLAPADSPDGVKEALRSFPDALCLDLGWRVHPSRRGLARQWAWGMVSAVARSRSTALAFLPSLEGEDLGAVVWPGLRALVVPVETPEEVRRWASALEGLERERGLPDPVGLLPFLETGGALWRARDIARTDRRVQGLVLGAGDLLFDLLDLPEEVPLLSGPVPRFPVPEYLWGRLAFSAADAGVPLYGLLATSIALGHLGQALGDEGEEGLLRAVRRARQAGFAGLLTLHPEGVRACREGFALPPEVRRWARQVLDGGGGRPPRASLLRLARRLLEEG